MTALPPQPDGILPALSAFGQVVMAVGFVVMVLMVVKAMVELREAGRSHGTPTKQGAGVAGEPRA